MLRISTPVYDIRRNRSRNRYKFRLVFDTTLKSVFRERYYIFSASREDPRGLRRSSLKIRVVTISILREISAFIIGNFNVAYDLGVENGRKLFYAGRFIGNRFLLGRPYISATSFIIVLYKKWRGRLNDSIKSDTYRLDVLLGNTPYAINAIEAIGDYRDLIIL
ncbi:hypothetical protein N7475_000013 [Penicillium sp. IBT 31633x]|nr:hypothetical protein N7475_000013 [Penicillium sp. IBT 31633x]